MPRLEVRKFHVNGQGKYLVTCTPPYQVFGGSLIVSGHLETDFNLLVGKIGFDLPYYNQRDEPVAVSIEGLSDQESETVKRLFDGYSRETNVPIEYIKP